MAKMRIYELAKELDVKPKELLEMLETIGVANKVPSSSIEDTAARSLRQMVTNKNNPQPETPATPEPAAPAKPSTFKSFRASEFRDARSGGAKRQPVAAPAPTPAPAPKAPPVAAESAPPAAPVAKPAESVEKPKVASAPAKSEAPVAKAPAAPTQPAAPPAARPTPPAPIPRPAPAKQDENENLADPDWKPAAEEAPKPTAAPGAPAPNGAAPLSAAQRRPLGPGRRPGSGRGGDFRRFDNRRGGGGGRRPGERDERFAAPVPEEPVLEPGSTVMLPQAVTVAQLAEKIGKSPSELIKRLFAMKIMRSANQVLETDVAGQLLDQFGYKIEVETSRVEHHLEEEDYDALVGVPPVVTVMGHVDHGKTSLLDVIRSANVQSGEAGGITQRIGAYETEHNGERIVFLDTPGHEAFTRMRARGAHVTDIAILVVAADDGVMPQTREAIDHARAAKVPVIVAINKMDRPAADPNHVKAQLAEAGLIPEDYGGDTVMIPVSAKTGLGVQDLLDMVLIMAEMQELKANPDGFATGTIIEAQQDPQRGPVATVLVHRGTLRVGDHIVVGEVFGRVRAMFDHKGDAVQEAGPKTPVSLIGLGAVPHASDTLVAVASAKAARDKAEEFTAEKQRSLVDQSRVTLQDVFAKIQQGVIKELNVIVKADGQGSVEAMCQSLEKMAHEEVRVKIVSRGVGAVNENDVNLASASDGVIIAFAVGADGGAVSLADREKVEIRTYDVIYDALNDVKAALEGLLTPMFEEKFAGEAEVVALFESSRAGKIAGCRIRNGKLVAGGALRVFRRDKQIYDGKLESLRHNKDIVKELSAPSECGVSTHGFNDFQEGDILRCFVQEQVKRTIN